MGRAAGRIGAPWSASNGCCRPLSGSAPGFFVLASLLAVVVICVEAPAHAVQFGIHVISRLTPSGAPEQRYSSLSGDGQIVRTLFANRVWTYPDGAGPLAPPGGTPMARIRDASPDMSILLGTIPNGPGVVVATRSGEVLWIVEPPPVSSAGNAAWVSPNGAYTAGGLGIVTSSGPTALDTGRWSQNDGFELLDRTGYVAADTVAVTDEGTVYGHGYSASPVSPGQHPVTGYYRDDAVRWTPSGQLERLAGVDESGRPWRLRVIEDVSPDGSTLLGWGASTVETEMGPDEVRIHGIYGDSGLIWSFWDERTDDFFDSPSSVGMAADGSLVYGNFASPSLPPRESRIWTADGTESTFAVFLRSMGIDPTGWEFGEILDVSDDGRTFLVYGSEVGGNGFQLLVVVPEPGTALLVGIGLLGLARGEGRASRRERG